jgi:nitrile hydratase subunit alpha
MSGGRADKGFRSDEELSRRVRALESLLLEKGILSDGLVDSVARAYEEDIGPMNGARVVARAWVDGEFRSRLLEDGTAAISEMGIGGLEADHLVVVENTEGVHNVVVCTLCSCYPWPLLGLPPTWYKSSAYRARIVSEPRKVLAEFGLELDHDVELRVWDSSSDLRYMVLPERPPGTEGWSEQDLATLVSRDAMVGVARVDAS